MVFFSASAADTAIFTTTFSIGMPITETLEAPEGLNYIFVRVCREKKEDPLILLFPELPVRGRRYTHDHVTVSPAIPKSSAHL